MSGDEYLRGVVDKYDKNHDYNYYETAAFSELGNIIKNWYNSRYFLWGPSMKIQQSGSRAKGTAIKGSSDMDMFLSITDRQNEDTLKNYYDEIYEFLKGRGYKVRKQNVSIGVNFKGYDIDVVPAKRTNSSTYKKDWQAYNDHWLWSNKKQTRTLTNIQRHIDLVRNSGLTKEIMLTKIWRNNHNLDFPSIYIEIIVREALQNSSSYSLSDNFLKVLRYIRDNIIDKKVVDPSNSQNIISESLTYSEKVAISKAASDSLNKQYWSSIVW